MISTCHFCPINGGPQGSSNFLQPVNLLETSSDYIFVMRRSAVPARFYGTTNTGGVALLLRKRFMAEQTNKPLIDFKQRNRTGGTNCAIRTAVASAVLLATFAGLSPVRANNLGENSGWQFQSATDAANLAGVQDMIQKKKAGGYGPTQYYSTTTTSTSNTSIGHQTNCTVTASAVGNSGSASAIASSPSTSGASAASLANSNTNSSQPGNASGLSSLSGTQSNLGTLGSTVNGSTAATAQGRNYQALNSNQSNTATQNAAVKGSTACAYGALN